MKAAKKPAKKLAPPKDLLADLVLANKILFGLNVVDAFGHISVRHPTDPNNYLMARHLPPGMVTAKDIVAVRHGLNAADPLRQAAIQRALHPRRNLQAAPRRDVGGALPRPLAHPVRRGQGRKAAADVPHVRLSRLRRPDLRDPQDRRQHRHADPHRGARQGAGRLARRQERGADARPRRHHDRQLDPGSGVPGGLFDGERVDPDAGASAWRIDGEVEFLNDEESEKSSRGRNVPRAWSLWKHQFSKA